MAARARTVEMPATVKFKRQGFDFAEGVFEPMTEVVETFEGKIERAAQNRERCQHHQRARSSPLGFPLRVRRLHAGARRRRPSRFDVPCKRR